MSLVLQRGPGFSETGVAEPRPAPSVPARPLPPVVELRNLPATFAGTLPCDGCPARRYELNLYPDDTFFVRTTPLARGANVDDDLGSWVLSSDRRVIVLKRASGATEHFAIRDNSTLRKLDERGREISGTQQDLRRTAAFRPLAARLTVSGAYARTGDVRRLIECSTGQTWNVAGESPLGAMPSAPQGRAGNAVGTFLTATGRLEAPGAGSDAAPVFAIERIEPSTTDGCPIRFAGLPLSGTYWRLTDLGATSIRTPAGARNEPAITFRAESRTFSGTGGCNRLAGRYESGPDALAMVAAGTMMACTTGGEHETAFARALTATRRYRILGTSLELFDDQGRAIARFEGRP